MTKRKNDSGRPPMPAKKAANHVKKGAIVNAAAAAAAAMHPADEEAYMRQWAILLDKRERELKGRAEALDRADREAEAERRRSQRLLLRALPHEIGALRSTASSLRSLLGRKFQAGEEEEEAFFVAVFSRQALYHVHTALNHALKHYDNLSAITEALAVMRLVVRLTHEFGTRCVVQRDAHGMFTGTDALRFGRFSAAAATHGTAGSSSAAAGAPEEAPQPAPLRRSYGQWLVFAYRQILLLACNPKLDVGDDELRGVIRGIQSDVIGAAGQRAAWCPTFDHAASDIPQLGLACGTRLEGLLPAGGTHLLPRC